MDIYIPRQPQERLYLVQLHPEGVSYREVAFFGWHSCASGTTPVGPNGRMRLTPLTSAWVIELAKDKFTSPTLGTGVYNDFKEVTRLLHIGFCEAAEQLDIARRDSQPEPTQQNQTSP
jgi:hypothetical protein